MSPSIYLLFLLCFVPENYSFLFPSSGSCGCSCSSPPPCPVQQSCQPVVACQTTTTCCDSCNSCKSAKRTKREILSNATFLADNDSSEKFRNDPQEFFASEKCNSEQLLKIIENKIDRVTAIAKRRIQEEAESKLNGRFNVICARGDFSYIANTELYCQHTVGDVTCFLFKQLSDVIRRRLA